MHRLFFPFYIVIFYSIDSNAQYLKDSLIIYDLKIFQKGEMLSSKKALEITKTVPEAHHEMKKAISNYRIAFLLGFVGGTMLGYSLGNLFSGSNPNWPIITIGSGLLIMIFPFVEQYKRHVIYAISIYNSKKQ